MAKKRKVSSHKGGPVKESNGKMQAYTTYEDLADSEDEFHINRDKVMLDDGPDVKRRKRWQKEDAELEPSDDEVLAYKEDSEDDDNAQNEVEQDSDEEEVAGEEEEEEEEGWGTSKKDYYNNDEIQTEADALEEEAEAKRLQQKKLSKMTDADFGLDDLAGWANGGAAGDEELDEGDVVTEKLKDVEITPDMPTEELQRILNTRYPEFDFIADEFRELHPVLENLQEKCQLEETSQNPVTSRTTLTMVKARALAAYMSTMSMYFAFVASPLRDNGEKRTMDPGELHEHPVMDYLVKTRALWEKVRLAKEPAASESMDEEIEDPAHGRVEELEEVIVRSSKRSRKERVLREAAEQKAAKRAQDIQEAEEKLADLSSLIPNARKTSKKSEAVVLKDDDSDFGEEETMDAQAAAEKAQKKKTLRFYTSQIAQKANKRADAGRDAGGDTDLPHRERLRDRQARLNAEAENRGKKLDEYGRGGAAGVPLGGDSDSGDDAMAGKVRDEGDEYYDIVAQASKSKKAGKQARIDALAQVQAEGAMNRVFEAGLDEDGKRAIGYVIEKNKGLAPKRKKDVRNPRVKKRKKYEEKKKKLASTRAVFGGGEGRGGYAGEKTGIKTGLVKSIKL